MESGGGPHQGGDLLFLQEIHEEGGEEEILLGNDVGGGPAFQRQIDVLYRQVKVEGGLIAHHVLVGKLTGVGHPLGEVNDAAVGDDDPLGGAGGAGGENGVHRVDVQHPPPAGIQQGVLGGMGKSLLRTQHRAQVRQGLGQGLLPGGVDQRGRGEGLQNPPQPGQRHLKVQGDIEMSGFQHPKEGGQVGRGVVDQHRHGPVVLGTQIGQRGAQAPGAGPQLAEGEGTGFIGKSQFMGEPGGRGVQIV